MEAPDPPDSIKDDDSPRDQAPDPDAIGLPPGVELPDAATFKRDQLWSWVVSNGVGFGILLAIWLLTGLERNFLLFLVVLLGLTLLTNIIRWASMAAEVRRRANRTH
jgi:hypothetical protein